MYRKPRVLIALAVQILSFLAIQTEARVNTGGANVAVKNGVAVLWREPGDIASRNLFYGPGGETHALRGTFTFQGRT